MNAQASLPSISAHLAVTEPQLNIDGLQFFKPEFGKHLFDLVAKGSEQLQPQVMTGRFLVLTTGRAIPFHRHGKKEKIYIFNGGGQVDVFMISPEGKSRKVPLLSTGQILVIPAGWSHALRCVMCTRDYNPCSVTIIASSQDASDIQWEYAADELCAKQA
jgi:hypothetical protein